MDDDRQSYGNLLVIFHPSLFVVCVFLTLRQKKHTHIISKHNFCIFFLFIFSVYYILFC